MAILSAKEAKEISAKIQKGFDEADIVEAMDIISVAINAAAYKGQNFIDCRKVRKWNSWNNNVKEETLRRLKDLGYKYDLNHGDPKEYMDYGWEYIKW